MAISLQKYNMATEMEGIEEVTNTSSGYKDLTDTIPDISDCVEKANDASQKDTVTVGEEAFKIIKRLGMDDKLLQLHKPSRNILSTVLSKEFKQNVDDAKLSKVIHEFNTAKTKKLKVLYEESKHIPIGLSTEITHCKSCNEKLCIYDSRMPSTAVIYDHKHGSAPCLIYTKNCSNRYCKIAHTYSYIEVPAEGKKAKIYHDDFFEREYFISTCKTAFTRKRLRHMKGTHQLLHASFKG